MENKNKDYSPRWREWKSKNNGPTGRILGGFVILTVGVVLLAYQLGTIILPSWVFTWKMLLILIGIYSGAKHSFRGGGWLIMILIGSVFLIEDIYPEILLRPYIWSIVVIGVGLIMIFSPSRRCRNKHDYDNPNKTPDGSDIGGYSSEDHLESVSVFSGVKKNILSKNFKGGEIVNCFGGTELNLMQADFDNKITLDITNIFGGTLLIVPSNWEIQTEITTILGGIEDKRPIEKSIIPGQNKILILKGVCLFGGISIKSY